MELSFDRVLAITGIVLTILLVVLDKAGKLNGPRLYWLLALTAIMTLPLALSNPWVRHTPWGVLKFSKGMLLVSIVMAGYSLISIWISPPTTDTKGQLAVSGDNASILEPSYNVSLIGLPIAIPAYSEINLILVRDGHKVDQETIVNKEARTVTWPTNEPVSPPEPVGVVQLANHGDIGLFDVSYSIVVRLGAQKNPGGVDDIPVKLTPVDLPLGAKPATFYVVNTSKDPALILFSDKAVAQVQGNGRRQTIAVRPRDITFFDNVPILWESSHKWAGNQILNPNQWKAKKKKLRD